MDNLENTEALETINVYDKADLKEQHELFRSREHSFRDYIRIYSPYLLCGVLLILALTTLFSLMTYLEDSSSYKTALSACSTFVNDSCLTPEGKYFTTYVTKKDPRILTAAHRKKYIFQNCPDLLKELHATSSASRYKQILDIHNKSISFANNTRTSLNGNKLIPTQSKEYAEINLIVFKNLLALKDLILQLTDFNGEDTSNATVKPIIEIFSNLTTSTPGQNRTALKTMNLMFINNYANITNKIKEKWLKKLDFENDSVAADVTYYQKTDEKIALLINDSMKTILEQAVVKYLETHYPKVFPSYSTLLNNPKKSNLIFEDLQKIKDLLKYFKPILDSAYIEKKPKSDTDATLEETDISPKVNVDSVYFAYQSLTIFFKKEFESILKFFISLVNMHEFILLITKEDTNTKSHAIITQIVKAVFDGIKADGSLLKYTNTKLVNIKSIYKPDPKEYTDEYIANQKTTATNIQSLIDGETDKRLFDMEAHNVPMDILSLTLILSHLGDKQLVGFIANNNTQMTAYKKITNELNIHKLEHMEINNEIKVRLVKLRVKKITQSYIKRKFDEFGFYNEKHTEIDDLLKVVKEFNRKNYTTDDELDKLIFGNDANSGFGKLLTKLIEFVKNNKDIWD